MERGFTDVCVDIGGMVTTHRFAICSNHIKALPDFMGNNRAMGVARAGSRFFCLGQYVHNSKTLIMLLHLPDDERWQVFQRISWINAFDEIVDACVERFKTACAAAPIPEFTDEEWLARCQNPIGMDNEGNLFD